MLVILGGAALVAFFLFWGWFRDRDQMTIDEQCQLLEQLRQDRDRYATPRKIYLVEVINGDRISRRMGQKAEWSLDPRDSAKGDTEGRTSKGTDQEIDSKIVGIFHE